MNQGKYVFSQIMELVSYKQFQTHIGRHKGDYKVRDFTCWKQFLCMAFGQLTHRESLTDTVVCLNANAHKLYPLGIGETIVLSTLSRANENRSYLIYQPLAMLLIKQAKALYLGKGDLEANLKNYGFALDATTLALCLSTFHRLLSAPQKGASNCTHNWI